MDMRHSVGHAVLANDACSGAIAAVLARADRLRRYALDLSVGYLQAVFVEMFGDPVTNPKWWDFAPQLANPILGSRVWDKFL
jgi:hypothetical protein